MPDPDQTPAPEPTCERCGGELHPVMLEGADPVRGAPGKRPLETDLRIEYRCPRCGPEEVQVPRDF